MSFIEHLLFHILFLLPNEHKRNKCVVVVDFGSWVFNPLCEKVSFQGINDEVDYLHSLGQTRTAQVVSYFLFVKQ